MTDRNLFLEAARQYTAEGLVIHPLHTPSAKVKAPGKQPILPGWPNRSKATEAELKEWFENTSKGFKDCNIGIVCGEKSDRTVIDLDRLVMVPVIFPEGLPNTRMSERIKGRGHVHFKYCADLPSFKCDTLGVEVLNNGNNAVLPPSIHPEGQQYHWKDPDAPVTDLSSGQIEVLKVIKKFPALVSKLRPCMQTMINERAKHNWHEGQGRRRMLALSTDLKRAGGTITDAHIIAALIYEDKYDRKRTADEWRNADPEKTWTCDGLRRNFMEIPPQCQGCKWREEYGKAKKEKELETDGKTPIEPGRFSEIYFVSLPGMRLWKYLEEEPPESFRIAKHGQNGDSNIYATIDADWFKRAEAQSIIERVQPENKYGIRNITIVEGALETDPIVYRLEVTMEDGSGGTIDLEEGNIFSFKYFKDKFAARFQKVLPYMKKDAWEAVLAPLLDNAKRVQDDTNEAPIILEVINRIENSEVVRDKKELVAGAGNRIWLDEETDTLWVLSRDLEPIAERNKIEPRRLAELIKHYGKGRGHRERIGKRRYYLWSFKPGLFELDRGNDDLP